MKLVILPLLLLSLISGCAKPFHLVDSDGPLATVTYVRRDVNHYISEETGRVVPAEEKDRFSGRLISTEYRRTFPTVIYRYASVACSSSPFIMGSLDLSRPGKETATIRVAAGVPLVNSYRTKYQSCERHCYKHFYTSSVFTPEENAHYEVVVEPIDGVTVYRLEQGQKRQMEVGSNLPDACQY